MVAKSSWANPVLGSLISSLASGIAQIISLIMNVDISIGVAIKIVRIAIKSQAIKRDSRSKNFLQDKLQGKNCQSYVVACWQFLTSTQMLPASLHDKCFIPLPKRARFISNAKKKKEKAVIV